MAQRLNEDVAYTETQTALEPFVKFSSTNTLNQARMTTAIKPVYGLSQCIGTTTRGRCWYGIL
ncbi:hypothetical protein KD5_30920 [Yersinia pseudotuberculosis]|nr:hypothetical protein YP72344_31750 [Yersinia pseudotuberculosis]BET63468.1 hypothetical protein YPSE1_29270 [Yersinia pseudotuberculosis]GAE12123.1 hypothetical protein YP1_061_00060 [Yersinia pseudotuberculosis NBRC 105692]